LYDGSVKKDFCNASSIGETERATSDGVTSAQYDCAPLTPAAILHAPIENIFPRPGRNSSSNPRQDFNPKVVYWAKSKALFHRSAFFRQTIALQSDKPE